MIPAVSIAAGLQGLRYFRCVSGQVALERCCSGRAEHPDAPKLVSTRGACCETLSLPSPEPQQPTSPTEVSSALLHAPPPVALTGMVPASPGRIEPPGVEPPPARELPLLHRALLI